jgi:hypothetical protein
MCTRGYGSERKLITTWALIHHAILMRVSNIKVGGTSDLPLLCILQLGGNFVWLELGLQHWQDQAGSRRSQQLACTITGWP